MRPAPRRPGFTECLNNLQQGNVAMWYDATSAAGSLEADDSPVKGKIGYVAGAGGEDRQSSGWLYTWSWAIQKASKKQDNAWKFISWASQQGLREARRQQDRLVARCRPASAPRPTRTPTT